MNLQVNDPKKYTMETSLDRTFTRLSEITQMAEYFAKAGGLVPAHFAGKRDACFVAITMALDLGMNPIAFMQGTFMVNGTLGYKSAFVISLFNQNKRHIYSEIQYKTGRDEVSGSYCQAYVTKLGTKEAIYGTKITAKMVKDAGWSSNKAWHNYSEQMFKYRAAVFLIRTLTPEIMFGFPTDDEIEDVRAGHARDVSAPIQSIENKEQPNTVMDLGVEVDIQATGVAQQNDSTETTNATQ